MPDTDLSQSYAVAIKNTLSGQPTAGVSAAEAPKDDPDKTGVPPEVYLPSDDLARVTDLALALGRPLLLQGEPGCGKTRLAHSVSHALAMPLEIAYVKSTSRAQDLLYTYDAVRRLFDSQLGAEGPKDDAGKPLARHARHYVSLGPLGRAIARAESGRRSVVLIDEIDKADLDFPNDLLWELDRMEFDVPEAPGMGHKAAQVRPFVIITHNEEKPLPPAFLRRCVFYYLKFPDSQREVERILAAHGIRADLSSKAASLISEIRKKDLNKKPGLAELIDWLLYQDAKGTSPDDLDALPDREAFLKDRADLDRVERDLAAT
ncbi:ATPase AAA [Virgisporangium aliadipatigenens]|uniref:ATPase AAA n=1 Tax=Virgisporangium aliadipatigenens TaxID=741659 RepID=A0A8J3YEE7_9ACTN|nr:MoxR family ATPase [Virgisporangium aliadipatigenens]GIJ43619.1 ATPase AAA [Virgisporangium aliadipatigenens]